MCPTELPGRDGRGIAALTFDVVDTVVDAYRGLAEGVVKILGPLGYSVDGPAFASQWLSAYAQFGSFDEINRQSLLQILSRLGISVSESDLGRLRQLWRQIPPFPDALPALNRLSSRFYLGTLSNLHLSLLAELSRNVNLPWTMILPAPEVVGRFKPDPSVYRAAAQMLCLPPQRILMVAAHTYDIDAAATQGFKTAYIKRSWQTTNETEVNHYDFVVRDFGELAVRLLSD